MSRRRRNNGQNGDIQQTAEKDQLFDQDKPDSNEPESKQPEQVEEKSDQVERKIDPSKKRDYKGIVVHPDVNPDWIGVKNATESIKYYTELRWRQQTQYMRSPPEPTPLVQRGLNGEDLKWSELMELMAYFGEQVTSFAREMHNASMRDNIHRVRKIDQMNR